MSQYDPSGIGALIYRNGKWGPGGSKEQVIAFLDDAIAICLAESGGNDQTISPKNKDGSTDYGLWQINDKAHPDLFKKYTWNNPGDNTEMARQVWKDAGNSFHPWATYSSQNGKPAAYLAFKGHGAKAYADLAGLKDPQGLSALLNPSTYTQGLGDTVKQAGKDASGVSNVVGNAVDAVFKFIKQGALAVGVFILAVVMFVAGIRLLLQNSAAYRNFEGKAIGAAKLAAVA